MPLLDPTFLNDITCTIEPLLLSLGPSSLSSASASSQANQVPLVELNQPPSATTRHLSLSTGAAKVLIEISTNSLRVSIRWEQLEGQDVRKTILLRELLRSLHQRIRACPQQTLLRRRPIEGYHLSVLLTYDHVERLGKDQILQKFVAILTQLSLRFDGLLSKVDQYDDLAAEKLVTTMLENHSSSCRNEEQTEEEDNDEITRRHDEYVASAEQKNKRRRTKHRN